ncbi:MAG: pilus assembly protein TadG-related protein [Actinomycetota bacterium]
MRPAGRSRLGFCHRCATLIRHAAEEQRGAVLAMIGLAMTIILTCGAIAVDLSALDRQGQVLQNTADSAALAGATVWGSTQDRDQARAIVFDIVRQNGVDVGSADIDIDITFPSPTELRVELTDTEPPVFLAGLVGIGNNLVRDATGAHQVCEDGCLHTVEVAEPQQPILTEGSGDGFVPIPTDGRVYAVNHHSSTIECVDQSTESICWPAQELFLDDVVTMNVIHPAVVGDRIYFLAWHGSSSSLPFGDGELRLGCWNLVTDNRCSTYAALPNVGHGTMYAADDAIYVFAANLDVYCFLPVTFAECTGYEGGRNTALTTHPGWGAWDENRAWNGDRVAHDDKVYVTLSRRGAVYLHCWDLDLIAPCQSFGVHLLHGTREGTTADFTNGRLFLHRDTSADPTAVCSIGIDPVVECFDFSTGSQDTLAEGALTAVASAVEISVPGLLGVVSYHEESNRVFFVSTFEDSTTYCYSFTDRQFCGDEYNGSPFGPAQTYGYASVDNCLLGLGHASVLFTLAPDLSGPCQTVSTSIILEPCACTGGSAWPTITIDEAEDVESFLVRIVTPAGEILLPDPTEFGTGEEPWIELEEGDVLDLSDLPLDHDELILEMEVTGEDDDDPWDDGDAPTLVIGRQTSDPVLVE